MAKMIIEAEIPFEWCLGCRMFELEETVLESADAAIPIRRTCANASICLNVYEQRARYYNEKNGEKK